MIESKKILDAAKTAELVLDKAAERAVDLIKDAKQATNEGFAVIATDISYIKRDVGEIKEKMGRDYVTRDEFKPVRNIAYGLVGVLGVATLGAIFQLLISR